MLNRIVEGCVVWLGCSYGTELNARDELAVRERQHEQPRGPDVDLAAGVLDDEHAAMAVVDRAEGEVRAETRPQWPPAPVARCPLLLSAQRVVNRALGPDVPGAALDRDAGQALEFILWKLRVSSSSSLRVKKKRE